MFVKRFLGNGKMVILDEVEVGDRPAGEYVLSFRWDSDTAAQVWQSCAFVTLYIK